MTATFRIQHVDPASLDDARQRALASIHEVVPAAYVYEVGSTAVAGVIGKQDLDFLVRLPATAFATTRDALDQRFARDPDQLSNAVYQGYRIDSVLDVAIQLTVEGSPHDTFLEFIERLRESDALREQYNELKRAFDGRAMHEYRTAKQRFIEGVLGEEPVQRQD